MKRIICAILLVCLCSTAQAGIFGRFRGRSQSSVPSQPATSDDKPAAKATDKPVAKPAEKPAKKVVASPTPPPVVKDPVVDNRIKQVEPSKPTNLEAP